MLAKTGIVDAADAAAIAEGLNTHPWRNRERARSPFPAALEDIHMNIESRLATLVGPAAGRLHTARSRNDQVALDFRLWVRDTLDQLDGQLRGLQLTLATKALAHAGSVMPGFTHMQSAQPITFGHHLLAYVEMFARDRGRFADARRRLNECPLGAAALAGTSFPIDRAATSQALGFDRPTANSLDSVSDRDFALEALAARRHLRRAPVALRGGSHRAVGDAAVRLRRARPTSSRPAPPSCRRSATPTPPNWCAARPAACSARAPALLVVMKGLPLAYSKDMQEDKEGTFDALQIPLALPRRHDGHGRRPPRPTPRACAAAAGAGFATATDLADWLVRHARACRSATPTTSRAAWWRSQPRAEPASKI